MLLTEPSERQDAHKKNREVVLKFLLCHKYSTLKNIAYELGHASTASASRILRRLCSEGLVKKEVIKEEFTKVTLFGITKFGVGALGEDVDEVRHFVPSRVSWRNLNHTLVNQRVGTWTKNFLKENNVDEIKVINLEFGDLKKYKHIVNFKHRPDLLVIGKLNNHPLLFLIETELSLKDTKRYRKIWVEYMNLKKARVIQQVWYFVKNKVAIDRVNQIKDKMNLIGENKKLLDDTVNLINIEDNVK